MKAADQTTNSSSEDTATIKQCCARLYESDIAKILLGGSFHPGGLRLTERLGTLMNLTPQSRVLDVASGAGTSAAFLAERFGCQVVGVDYSVPNVKGANEIAAKKTLATRVQFEIGDAERLQFSDDSFDAVVCECALCTFPNKAAAAREFARVLCPGGRVGISDLTRSSVLPKELESLLAWIACIADAQPVESYTDYLRSAGFDVEVVENHDRALTETVHHIQLKLLSAEVLAALKKPALPNCDFASAKQMAMSSLAAVDRGQLGYAIFIATRPALGPALS